MKLKTRHFGEININEDGIITFPEGLLGFEGVKQYVIIQNPDSENPFMWLQSVDEPNLAFVIVNPFIFKSDYEFDLPDKVVKDLKIEKRDDVFIYSIAVLPDNIKNMTINLAAPLIINFNIRKGKQLVLDTFKYSLKFKIFEQNDL